MYASAAEALAALLDGRVEKKCTITSMSHEVKTLTSGIKYYAVQVTSETGSQYGISAFGEEAEELYKVAMGRPLEVPLILSAQ